MSMSTLVGTFFASASVDGPGCGLGRRRGMQCGRRCVRYLATKDKYYRHIPDLQSGPNGRARPVERARRPAMAGEPVQQTGADRPRRDDAGHAADLAGELA